MDEPDEPRAEAIGNDGDRIDLEEFKRAVQAPRASEPPDVAAAERKMNIDVWALRRSMVRQLEPLLPQGVDTSKIDALFADYQQRRDELLKQRLLELRQTMSALAQQRGAAAAARRRALEVLTQPGLPFTPISIALKPVWIWAKNPSTFLVGSFYAPAEGYSWAKVDLDYSHDTGASSLKTELIFNYIWRNPSDYHAVVNAKSSIVLSGTCTVAANPGWGGGGTSSLSALARVQPVEWWKEPLAYPPYQQESLKQLFGYISAEGGFALWSVGDIDGVTLAGDAHELRHDLFVVPPDATAMFEVRVEFSYYLDSNAWVAINFAEPYFAIANHLQLELLTTPSPINALRDP